MRRSTPSPPTGGRISVDGADRAPSNRSATARKAARQCNLRHAADTAPGIRRLRRGRGFRYVNPLGKPLTQARPLQRIKSLAIPPAWTDVWICLDPTGHLQATGRDARGRKQYLYHPRWRATRDENKFSRMIAFGHALPRIRRRVRTDLRQRGLGHQKVVAAVVRLLELSSARVGNEEYVQQNQSYGLTTLRDRHARVKHPKLQLRFRGKSGKEQVLDIDHPRLARVVKRCRDLPGLHLFQYIDEDGKPHKVSSDHVNQYLAEISGADFTAKDFRTWNGTVLAALALRECERSAAGPRSRRDMVRAIEQVAERLGNTPAVCKKSYVHPAILDAYADGTLTAAFRGRSASRRRSVPTQLRAEERAVVALLRNRSNVTEDEKLDRDLKRTLALAESCPRVATRV